MALQVGDVVKARLVATVTAIDQTSITVRTFGDTEVIFPKSIANDPGFTYEEIPLPEPAYVAGSIYMELGGNAYLRRATDQAGDRWQVLIHSDLQVGEYVHEDVPQRPLTLMVPATPLIPPE